MRGLEALGGFGVFAEIALAPVQGCIFFKYTLYQI
jgi:hypothetical protein